MSRWFTRHLPELPDVDEENLKAARKARKKSTEDLVTAVLYRQAVQDEVDSTRQVVLRNHLAPSFEAVYRRGE